MRMVNLVAAAAIILVAVGAFMIGGGDLRGQAQAASIEDGTTAGHDAYRLSINGLDKRCVLSAGNRIDDKSRTLDLSDGCGGLGVPLGGASLWVEGAFGTVTLADADGRPLVEFGASDGAAFESFRPAEPMMSLSVLR